MKYLLLSLGFVLFFHGSTGRYILSFGKVTIFVSCLEVCLLFTTIVFLFLFAAQTFCNGVPIYSREEWGARPANCETFMPTPVTYIFIHHTVTAECSDFNSCAASARAVQDFHMDGNGNKILYTVLFTRTFCKQRTNVRKGKEI